MDAQGLPLMLNICLVVWWSSVFGWVCCGCGSTGSTNIRSMEGTMLHHLCYLLLMLMIESCIQLLPFSLWHYFWPLPMVGLVLLGKAATLYSPPLVISLWIVLHSWPGLLLQVNHWILSRLGYCEGYIYWRWPTLLHESINIVSSASKLCNKAVGCCCNCWMSLALVNLFGRYSRSLAVMLNHHYLFCSLQCFT